MFAKCGIGGNKGVTGSALADDAPVAASSVVHIGQLEQNLYKPEQPVVDDTTPEVQTVAATPLSDDLLPTNALKASVIHDVIHSYFDDDGKHTNPAVAAKLFDRGFDQSNPNRVINPQMYQLDRIAAAIAGDIEPTHDKRTIVDQLRKLNNEVQSEAGAAQSVKGFYMAADSKQLPRIVTEFPLQIAEPAVATDPDSIRRFNLLFEHDDTSFKDLASAIETHKHIALTIHRESLAALVGAKKFSKYHLMPLAARITTAKNNTPIDWAIRLETADPNPNPDGARYVNRAMFQGIDQYGPALTRLYGECNNTAPVGEQGQLFDFGTWRSTHLNVNTFNLPESRRVLLMDAEAIKAQARTPKYHVSEQRREALANGKKEVGNVFVIDYEDHINPHDPLLISPTDTSRPSEPMDMVTYIAINYAQYVKDAHEELFKTIKHEYVPGGDKKVNVTRAGLVIDLDAWDLAVDRVVSLCNPANVCWNAFAPIRMVLTPTRSNSYAVSKLKAKPEEIADIHVNVELVYVPFDGPQVMSEITFKTRIAPLVNSTAMAVSKRLEDPLQRQSTQQPYGTGAKFGKTTDFGFTPNRALPFAIPSSSSSSSSQPSTKSNNVKSSLPTFVSHATPYGDY